MDDVPPYVLRPIKYYSFNEAAFVWRDWNVMRRKYNSSAYTDTDSIIIERVLYSLPVLPHGCAIANVSIRCMTIPHRLTVYTTTLRGTFYSATYVFDVLCVGQHCTEHLYSIVHSEHELHIINFQYGWVRPNCLAKINKSLVVQSLRHKPNEHNSRFFYYYCFSSNFQSEFWFYTQKPQ